MFYTVRLFEHRLLKFDIYNMDLNKRNTYIFDIYCKNINNVWSIVICKFVAFIV